jgi:hypothetical protein
MLPETLDLPTILAATLVFDGDLTSRDQSILLTVSWLAGRHGLDDGRLMVNDLRLRRTLGNVRRLDENREFARYARLERSTVRTDERVMDLMDGVEAPVVTRGMRRRTVGGSFEWTIDPAIADAFRIENGDEIISVPLQLLIQSRCRYTLPIFLRAAGWGAGEFSRKWLRRGTKDTIVLRIPVDALRSELGVPDGTKAADIARYVLTPAQTEIASAADLSIDFEPIKAPSIKAGGGRVVAFDIMVPKVPSRVAIRHVPEQQPTATVTRFPTTLGLDDLEDTPF